MATTVTWVRDAGSRYEISSKEHLLQLMNQGSLYTDAGTPPTNYWGSNYIQTADIDLADSHADITPIGNAATNFTGMYDGAGLNVSNWSYDRGTADNGAGVYVGMFGYCSKEIKNMRLRGVWTLAGSYENGGLLGGFVSGASDVDANFDTGTAISGGKSNASIGSLFGQCLNSSAPVIADILLRGSVTFDPVISGEFVGGIFGRLNYGRINRVRNLADFPNGMVNVNRGRCGGIAGTRMGCQGLTNVVNAMTGDISCFSYAGGIIGYYQWSVNWDSVKRQPEKLVNSMTGNISALYAGGIFGLFAAAASTACAATKLVNYMNGDIISVATTHAGGIVGSAIVATSPSGTNFSVSNSIVAMHGAVRNSVMGSSSATLALMEASVNTDFGLSFDYNEYATTNALSGFLEHPDFIFTLLPYLDLGELDSAGNIAHFDFVMANVGGNQAYSGYTHLTLHKGEVHAPIYTDFGLDASNTETYLTFSNVATNQIFSNNSLVIVVTDAVTVSDYLPVSISVTPRPINLGVIFPGASGAVAYMLTIQKAGTQSVRTVAKGFTDLSLDIDYLEPGTDYKICIYGSTDGLVYTLHMETTTRTLENSAENYDKSNLFKAGVGYDLTTLNKNSVKSMLGVGNELFATGDAVVVSLTGKRSKTTKFVGRGESASIVNAEALLLPFDASAGASQSASLTLSDSTSVSVIYDEVNGTVDIGGEVLEVNDSLVLDGKKMTVVGI